LWSVRLGQQPTRVEKMGVAEREEIMKGTWRTSVMSAAGLVLFAGIYRLSAQQAPGTKSPTPAAKVAEEVITLEEVEEALKPQLAKIAAR